MHVARVPMTADENRRRVSGVRTAVARVAHVPIARGSSRRTFGGGYACPGGAYCAEVGVAEIHRKQRQPQRRQEKGCRLGRRILHSSSCPLQQQLQR